MDDPGSSPHSSCIDNADSVSCIADGTVAPVLDPVQQQRQLSLTFNYWTLGIVMPAVAVFGILANTASIVVLTRSNMRSSPINVYLAGLSAFDGMLLLMTLLLYPALSYCELEDSTSSPWCQYFFYSALFTYPISLIMQSGSVWTLTAITIDRFIAIMWPLHSRDWCTSRRANWVLVIIVLWSLLYNTPSFFELRLISIPLADPNSEDYLAEESNASQNSAMPGSSWQMVLTQTDLRRDPSYVVAYKGYCYLIFMLLLPAGLMITLNVFVTLSVRKAYRLRKAMSGREEKERRCTIMAILVVVTFLVLNSLAFVNNLIEIFATNPPPPPTSALEDTENLSLIALDENHTYTEEIHQQVGPTKSTAYLLLVTLGNLLVVFNSAIVNFSIYCALGLRFRRMFCKIFCPRRCSQSLFAADIMANEKSYQSLTVRYSVRGATSDIRKRNDTKTRSSISTASPMTARRRSSTLLVEDGCGSGMPSSLQSAASTYSPSLHSGFNSKKRKSLGSFV